MTYKLTTPCVLAHCELVDLQFFWQMFRPRIMDNGCWGCLDYCNNIVNRYFLLVTIIMTFQLREMCLMRDGEATCSNKVTKFILNHRVSGVFLRTLPISCQSLLYSLNKGCKGFSEDKSSSQEGRLYISENQHIFLQLQMSSL